MGKDDSERYGINKNLWRKTYGYSRRKPRIIQFFDSGSQSSSSLDQSNTYRHRDLYVIKGINRQEGGFVLPEPPPVTASYEEGLVSFSGECEKSFDFVGVFPSDPIVVFTVEPTVNDSDNINIHGHALPSVTGANISLSAPFTGNIRYRAAIAGGPFSESTIYTASFDYYAGYIDITNSLEYTASYTIPTGTLEFRATFHDVVNNGESNTYDFNDNIGTSTSEHSLSMETTTRIHFIVTSQ